MQGDTCVLVLSYSLPMDHTSLVFYIILALVITLMIVTWDEYTILGKTLSEHGPLSWHSVQTSRQKTLLQTCQSKSMETHEVVLPESFTYFVEKNLLWCRVFKVGTPPWQGVVTYFDLTGTNRTGAPRSRHFQIGNNLTFQSIQNNQPIVFVVVRHPFTRLVSAYQDKIVDKGYPQLKNKTFAEFLHFVIEQSASCYSARSCDKMDLHWRPYDQICSFCQVNYTVISKLEIFDADRDMILGMVGIEGERVQLHGGSALAS